MIDSVVPLLVVADIEASWRFYVALGFVQTNEWRVDGRLRWCWLQFDGAAVMLQERQGQPAPDPNSVGAGVSLNFQCDDAILLYRRWSTAGISSAQRPFVGNANWVVPLVDPDGYKLFFQSPTDAAEETELASDA